MNGGEGAENLRRGTIGKGFLGREEWLLARDSYGSLRPARYATHLPLPVPGMKAMVEYHACPEGVSRWPRLVGFSWAVDKKSACNQQENTIKTASAEVHNKRRIGLSKLFSKNPYHRIDR